jgi:hypothetical protein
VPCIGLRQAFLESAVFTDFASENLIPVNADYSRKKKNTGTNEQIKRNKALTKN